MRQYKEKQSEKWENVDLGLESDVKPKSYHLSNFFPGGSVRAMSAEKLEKVPSLSSRIETFKQLVDRLGKGSVV